MDLRTKFLTVVAFILFGLGAITTFQFQSLERTRLVFCDVGQGDAILVMSGTRQVLIDGGPGSRVLDCLGKRLPFWDRQIEMVVLTHPQQDHLEGLIAVLERYEVGTVVTTNVANNTELYKEWQKALASSGIRVWEPDVDDRFVINQGRGETLSVLWPSSAKAAEWRADPPSDLNETSVVMRFDAGPSTSSGSTTCAYLTGDITKEILGTLIDRPCDILKISHHGSRTGTNEEILEKAKPKVGVIQVGKNNRFGHPHKEVLDLLISKGVSILRNDINGIIEVESKVKSYKVKIER